MRQHRFSSNVEYNPLRAVVTRLEDGAKVIFDIIPAACWQENDAAWDESQNHAWSVAESVAESLEAGAITIEDGKEAIWAEIRSQWYSDDLDAIDEKADQEEAKREWEGVRDE